MSLMKPYFNNKMTYNEYAIHLNEEYSTDTDNEDNLYDINIYHTTLIENNNNTNANTNDNKHTITTLTKLKNTCLHIFCCIS